MKEQIKSQLREFLNTNLGLCKQCMQAQDLTMAKAVWQQAIGATVFVSVNALYTYCDADFSNEIDALWEDEYREAFNKVLFPGVGE